jgi:beta-glucosidase
MAQTIEGMQDSGVQATAKHWLVNEQELGRETMSSDVPDRVLRELYVWPFMDAVKSNVAAFMCRYVVARSGLAGDQGTDDAQLQQDQRDLGL